MKKQRYAMISIGGTADDSEELTNWSDDLANGVDGFTKEQLDVLFEVIASRYSGPLLRSGYMMLTYLDEMEGWLLVITPRGERALQKWREGRAGNAGS